MGISTLAPSVWRYFQEGLAPATCRSYDSAVKKFDKFCDNFRVTDPFLVTETLPCSFAAYLGDQGLSSKTIRSYLAGVGLLDPRDHSSLPILCRVQAGIKRANLGTGTARVRLPVTPQLLRQIKQQLEAIHHNERVVFCAVYCVAFFWCFRLGELLLESTASFDQHRHLAWGDVVVDNQADPRMLHIHLKQSKGLSALAHGSTSDPDPIYINPVRTRIHVEAIAIRS